MKRVEETYGAFPGGDFDPRRFKPDREVNTAAEIAAWERLCAAWDAGGGSIVPAHGFQSDGTHHGGSVLGYGLYEVEADDEDDGPDSDGGEPLPLPAVAGGWR